MPRRRLTPPLIPGLWAILVFLILISSVAGYYYLLARQTRFERSPVMNGP
jgi:hypothetical protein